MEVTLVERPAVVLWAACETGPYAQSAGVAWGRVWQWAGAAGLLPSVAERIGYGLDNPATTAPEACRYVAGLTFAQDPAPAARIERIEVSGGPYACCRHDGPPGGISAVFRYLWRDWAASAGRVPDLDRPFLEIYAPPEGPPDPNRMVVDCLLPVVA